MIKKIKEKITLRHLKPYYIEMVGFDLFKDSELQEFYILYKNDKYESVWGKLDLIDIIEKRAGDIRYIFDATDRIILEKDIDVNFNNGDNKNEN